MLIMKATFNIKRGRRDEKYTEECVGLNSFSALEFVQEPVSSSGPTASSFRIDDQNNTYKTTKGVAMTLLSITKKVVAYRAYGKALYRAERLREIIDFRLFRRADKWRWKNSLAFARLLAGP